MWNNHPQFQETEDVARDRRAALGVVLADKLATVWLRHRRRRAALAVLGALVGVALGAPAAQAAAPTPTVQGNRLTDSTTGEAWVPRGVNWPSFEYACQQGWAYARNSANAATAAAMASWHINVVRIPLNQDCWLGDNGLPRFGDTNGYRAALRAFVDTLNNAGIVVILDLHWFNPTSAVQDGQRAMAGPRSVDFWSSVASAYKDTPSVLFDAFNEPYSRHDDNAVTFDLTWNCWQNGMCQAPIEPDTVAAPLSGTTYATVGMTQIVASIRGAGASQPILLGGRDYANDLREWLTHRPHDTQLVASFHNYNGQRCHTQACWNAEIAPVAATVPVVTGEFGERDCTHDFIDAFMNWADAHDVGYVAWAWWTLDPNDCSQLDLLTNLDGTPKAPLGTALKDHLAALAARP
jgi:endoglucanase